MQHARISNLIRLAGFPVAYGLSGALIGGTFNRIMVAELGMPLSLVAFFFTIPLFVSPLRVWFGYLDWEVRQEVIEQIMGKPMPNPLTKVKDFCTEQGLDFETIKPALQAEVDKIK